MTKPIVVLFQQDLRLQDHPALNAAARTDQPIIPCFILDDVTPGRWIRGGASRWWLHHSLQSLADAIKQRRGQLVFRRGETSSELTKLVEQTGTSSVYWTRGYEPYQVDLEQKLHEVLVKEDIETRRFGGSLLFEPDEIKTNAGDPFKVFTPFYNACLKYARSPRSTPDKIDFSNEKLDSDKLDDWKLLPSSPNWANQFSEYWTPGETGARQQLEQFLEHCVTDYKDQRDFPDRWTTSRLSPHLHFGEISPHQIWQAGYNSLTRDATLNTGAEAYLRQLAWREFSYHLLFHWPHFPERPFREQFRALPWHEDAAALKAWQKGRTGYPIVDAGMRELWQTGWMHNRVRMIVASFLVKHLLIPWQQGAAWFWDTLVDADLANNSAGWQWVAGCGADAAPYFRIFNPTLQGAKFDANGNYVRRWVPELAKLSNKFIHEPWKASEQVLNDAKVRLGETYPHPIVDHAFARQRALDAFQQLKSMDDQNTD